MRNLKVAQQHRLAEPYGGFAKFVADWSDIMNTSAMLKSRRRYFLFAANITAQFAFPTSDGSNIMKHNEWEIKWNVCS